MFPMRPASVPFRATTRPLARHLGALCAFTVFSLLTSVAGSAQELYTNGPLSNSSGTASNGADESILETSIGDQDLGRPNGPDPFDQRVADDFEVPGPANWTVTGVVVYGYQDLSTGGRGELSTFTNISLRIWDGEPGMVGSSIILQTSGLDESGFTNVYRVSEATSGSSRSRPIFGSLVPVNIVLPPGTYWVDWQAEGSVDDGGPFVPPIPSFGDPGLTGDAKAYSVNTGWVDLVDSNSGNAKGVPFRIEGVEGGQLSVLEVPTVTTWGLLTMLALLLVVALRHLRIS